MRKFFKRWASFFLVPATKWYLRKQRTYSYKDIPVTVFSGVFHPGFFYSTKFLIDFLSDQPLKNKTLLELGCGTALISIFAAKNGAIVTASDVSQKAIDNAALNVKANQAAIN